MGNPKQSRPYLSFRVLFLSRAGAVVEVSTRRRANTRTSIGRANGQPSPAVALEKPEFAEADHLAAGDDQMVQHANVHRLQGLSKPPRDELVGCGNLGHSRRVRMREYHGGCVALQRLLHHFARVYGGAVDGAPEELNEFDHPMSAVEKHAAEGFEFTRSESQGQKITGGLGRREGAATAYAARELLACRSDDFLCRGGYGLAGTAEREQWFGVRHR